MAKVVTLEELKKHASKDSLYVLLHGKGGSFYNLVAFHLLNTTI
jgi:hypothetical protein